MSLAHMHIKTDYPVQTLINALVKNKAAHEEHYQKAVSGYNQKVKEDILQKKQQLDNWKENESLSVYVNWNPPVSLAHEYDKLITIFSAMPSQTVELSLQDVNYVLNDSWEWASTGNSALNVYATRF